MVRCGITGTFQRTVGAAADLKEILYIATLHQTSVPDFRANGTVSATDIRIFLISRYGIYITEEQAKDITHGLGGQLGSFEVRDADCSAKKKKKNTELNPGPIKRSIASSSSKSARETKEKHEKKHENCEQYLDIISLTNVILIPTFLKYADELGVLRDDDDDDTNKKSTTTPTTHILSHVVDIIRRTVYPDSPPTSPLTVNSHLIRDILLKLGEADDAADDHLISLMIDAAGGAGVEFNERTLARALTFDVRRWEVGKEEALTTSFVDVFGGSQYKQGEGEERFCAFESTKKETSVVEMTASCVKDMSGDDCGGGGGGGDCDKDDGGDCDKDDGGDKDDKDDVEQLVDYLGVETPDRVKLNSFIDTAVDMHYSLAYYVVLWIFYIFLVAGYVTSLNEVLNNRFKCPGDKPTFGCTVLITICVWISLGVALCVGGLIMIIPIAMGNKANADPRAIKISTVAVTMHSLVSAYSTYDVLNTHDYIGPEDKNWVWKTFLGISMGLGIILILINIGHLYLVVMEDKIENQSFMKKLTIPSNIVGTANMKKAAVYKINTMIDNAYKIHTHEAKSRDGEAMTHDVMTNFILFGESRHICGGWFWTYHRLRTGDLFTKDGIWIHTRMVIGLAGQIGIFLTIFFILIKGIYDQGVVAMNNRADVMEEYGDGKIDTFLLQETLLFMPTDYMIYASFYPALGVASLCAFLLIIVYIPSTVSTILMFRCGEFPSFTDPDFSRFRLSSDTVYLNLAYMLYAFTGSFALIFFVIGGLVFLFLWPITKGTMMTLLAWVIGLTVTVLLKMFMTCFCRNRQFAGFLRKRPFSANMTTLMLECWSVGLGASVILTRISQFLLAAIFYVGRIDSVFLAEEVNLLGYAFDYVPSHYTKELLMHEAHRHPFLERLSAMYMMRLRHGINFSSIAGACWRDIFVLMLMPWMAKYRYGDHSAPNETKDVDESEEIDNQLQMVVAEKNDSL